MKRPGVSIRPSLIEGATYRDGRALAVEVGAVGQAPPSPRRRLAGRAVRLLAWPAGLLCVALALRVQLAGILPLALALVAGLPGVVTGLLALGDRLERPPEAAGIRPCVLCLTAAGLRVRFSGLGERHHALPDPRSLHVRRINGAFGLAERRGPVLLEGLDAEAASELVEVLELHRTRIRPVE